MKILLTGNKGFIGQNFEEEFKRYNWEVDGLDYDGTNIPTIPDLTPYDWVVHLGAITNTTEKNVDKVMALNYEFSCDLLDQCIETGTNIQYASSASVYGKCSSTSFKESDPVSPLTPYAWSKYMFERYAERNAVDIICQGFRYFNVYGPHEEHKIAIGQASPYSTFEHQADTIGKIYLFQGSDKFSRDFIHVQELIRKQVFFMNKVVQSGIWNMGTGKTKSFYKIAELISLDKEVPIQIEKLSPELMESYQEHTCADVTKLYESLDKWGF